jgi:hypothetical protein
MARGPIVLLLSALLAGIGIYLYTQPDEKLKKVNHQSCYVLITGAFVLCLMLAYSMYKDRTAPSFGEGEIELD